MLSLSPMGKVPVLETGGVFLSETNVILEYLDETTEGPALYPADPLEKAQVKQLVKHIELYLSCPPGAAIRRSFSVAGSVTKPRSRPARLC